MSEPSTPSLDPRLGTFAADVISLLPYEPNDEQLQLIAAFAHFLWHAGERSALVLNGYAGTGKTSMIGAIVGALNLIGIKALLLAPTGRAAKIFTEHSGHTAFTIHRKIYRQSGYLSMGFNLGENKHTNTIFFVDEASMIANSNLDGSPFGSGRLLDDLMQYVYNGAGCRLVLMGDVAQLPPVGQASSPALNSEVIKGYGLHVYDFTLKQIGRQAATSGILHNATLLREIMRSGVYSAPILDLSPFTDIENVSGEFLIETISDAYDRDGTEESIIITRSNHRAVLYNMGIRNQILYREDELTSGDMLIVAKNNYYWARDYDELDFIANGDILRIKRVWGEIEQCYGLRFATVTLELTEHEHIEIEAKIVLDALTSDAPSLNREQQERLFTEIYNEQSGDKRARYKAMKENPYFNALQVKYAYAVTCHKAQGGGWKNVFIDLASIQPEWLVELDFLRWFYTALTRAEQHVYLINSPLEAN